MWAFLQCGHWELLLAAEPGLLTSEASLVAEHGTGLVPPRHRLSSSTARGIFPDQGLNPCLLHWQVDSLPLSRHGSVGTAL